MKNLLINFCTGSILAIGMAACSSDETILSDTSSDAITFTSNVTRASGTSWAAQDKIGVYMKAHSDVAWDGTTVVNNGANIAYTTVDGKGNFTSVSSALTYPKGSTGTYDFISYYPYSETVTDGIYKVDVKDQSKPAAIDLLYSNNLTNVPSSSKVNPLSFSHKLVNLKLIIKSADGKDISGLKVAVQGVPATADFNLKDATFTNVAAATSDIPMYTSGTGTTLTASAFLLPQEKLTESGLQVQIASADGKISRVVPLKDANGALVNNLKGGNTYTFNINVKNIGTTITPATYARWMETPTITDAQLKDTRLQYVTHSFTDGGKSIRNYSLLYNKDLKVAYWVAYPLNNYYTKKTVSRTNAWGYDPNVYKEDQVNLGKSTPSGLVESSKYDRGHQIPSGDRVVTREANEQTFYYTNMTPQIGKDMNQTIWAALESAVHGWSSNIDTLYVVTGAGFNDSTSIKYTGIKGSSDKVAVPDYYYKAILKIVDRKTGEAITIAYKLDNRPYGDKDYTKYAMSVSELEKLTHFTFFPGIDKQYKETFDPKIWQ